MDNDIVKFSKLLSTAKPIELFEKLHSLCQFTIGVKLFTCSRFDTAAGRAERIFSSNRDAYPLSGLKDIVPNRWTRIVLDEQRPFVSSTKKDIREVFPDYKKIEALGLGAAINLPIFVQGKILGTLNLLDSENAYSPNTLNEMEPISVCGALSFMSYEIGQQSFSA